MAVTIKGQLGALDCAGDGVLRDVYTVDPARESSVRINVVNRTTSPTLLKLAHIKNGVAAGVDNEDFIWFNLDTADLAVNNAPIPNPIITMAAGDTIAISSSAEAVTIQVNGIEGDAP